MKNYDDLQRFKDKTRTGDIKFKDFSAQKQNAATSDWAIINQLAGGNSDSALAKAGSVAVPVPQPLKPGELEAAFAPFAQAPIAPLPDPAVPAPSLFEQLIPQAPAAAPQPLIQPAPTPVAAPAPQIAPVAVAPAAPLAAPAPAEPVRFEQLFATKATARVSHPVKDLPLQPLLEKIASCR
jgi:hypothetical protein